MQIHHILKVSDPFYFRNFIYLNCEYIIAVDPVVQGKLRAEAFYSNDIKCDRHLALVLHGDASFSGQGVVMETFNLNDLPAYTIYGAIHIVVNNQIGFTTGKRLNFWKPTIFNQQVYIWFIFWIHARQDHHHIVQT